MIPCPFCVRIKAGDFESFSGDPTVVWFEPLNPVTPGHMLFVPVRHVEDALADPYTTAITAEIASRWWAKKWGIRSGERDCNLITSVGANATQSVRHLHVHLVPRRTADGLALPWTGQQRAETGPAAPSTTSPAPEDPDLTLVGLSPAQAYEAGVAAERQRYENAITWNTSCLSCATVLDSCYAETVRRERVEEKLAAVRELARQLGDRTDEPALPAPEVKVQLPLSDRRIVEPIRRRLLEILDGQSAGSGEVPP